MPSAFDAAETAQRLFAALDKRRLAVFAKIDHRQGAERVGLELRPALLVIFGAAEAGTPLMQIAPTMAIDLPLKALVWEDVRGAVWLSYNDPFWLAQRHGLADRGLAKTQLQNMADGLAQIAREATGQSAA